MKKKLKIISKIIFKIYNEKIEKSKLINVKMLKILKIILF